MGMARLRGVAEKADGRPGGGCHRIGTPGSADMIPPEARVDTSRKRAGPWVTRFDTGFLNPNNLNKNRNITRSHLYPRRSQPIWTGLNCMPKGSNFPIMISNFSILDSKLQKNEPKFTFERVLVEVGLVFNFQAQILGFW